MKPQYVVYRDAYKHYMVWLQNHFSTFCETIKFRDVSFDNNHKLNMFSIATERALFFTIGINLYI